MKELQALVDLDSVPAYYRLGYRFDGIRLTKEELHKVEQIVAHIDESWMRQQRKNELKSLILELITTARVAK